MERQVLLESSLDLLAQPTHVAQLLCYRELGVLPNNRAGEVGNVGSACVDVPLLENSVPVAKPRLRFKVGSNQGCKQFVLRG